MHRVASRQRLFSWDHFDARPADYEENDNTDNNTNNNNHNNNNEHDAHDNDQNIIRTTIPKTTSVPNTNIEAFASSAELILPFASEDDRSTNNENDNDNDADYDNDNTDDLSDYRTCISMSRHASMLFTRSSSFGLHDAYDDNDDDDDDDNDGHGHGDALTNVISDDEDSDEENCHDNCSVITTPLSMISMSIPRTQPETEPSSILLSESINDVLPSSPSSSSIFDMHLSNQDVQLHILSFLDLNGLRSMNLTCRYFMNLLSEPHHHSHSHAHAHAHAHAHSHQHDYSYQDQSSCVRNAIWWNIIKTTWPSLSLGPNEQGCNNRYNNTDTPTTSQSLLTPDMVQFVAREKSTSKNDINDNDDNVDDDDDDDNDSVVMNHNNNNHHKNNSPKAINYGALLIQAKPITNSAPAPPTCIDPSFFQLKSTIQTELIRVVIDNSITLHRRRQQPTLQHRTKLFSHYVMDVNKDDLNAFQVTDGGSNGGIDDGASNGGASRNLQLEVVQYVGRVGVGDRSIRSNQPFPRPLESLPVFIPEKDDGEEEKEENDHPATSISYSSSRGSRKRSLSFGTSHIGTDVSSNDNSKVDNNTSVPMKFLNRLRTCNKRASTVGAVIRHNQHRMSIFANSQFNHGNTTMTSSSSSSSSRNINSECKLPFVSPIVSRIIYKKQQECPILKRVIEIDLTPRLMAYFEVSILPRDLAQEVDVNSNTNPTTTTATTTANRLPLQIGEEVEEREASSSACVAIGLSKREYSSSVRMPGWDSYSYGYHGDDGGIFHSKGDMIRVYGPKYNVGDTVGCGVNYSNGGIFFTLNGDFLGYAWCNEKVVMDGRVDLYPTIGVDAPNPLVCNFGNEQPFIWDFPKFVATNGSLSVP